MNTDTLSLAVGLHSAARLVAFRSRLLAQAEGVTSMSTPNDAAPGEVRSTVTAVSLHAEVGNDPATFSDYDRVDLACGHSKLIGNDDDANASLVGAETRCSACSAQYAETA